MNDRAHIALDLAAILFYCAAIFFLSSIPTYRLPAYPFPGFDILGHIAVYAGLGMLLCRFLANHLRRSAPAAMLIAVTLATLYGLSDEIHQSFVPGRFTEAGDFTADAVGAVMAVVLWYLLMRPRHRPLILLQAELPAEEVGDDVSV